MLDVLKGMEVVVEFFIWLESLVVLLVLVYMLFFDVLYVIGC